MARYSPDPFEELTRLQERMSRLFGEMSEEAFGPHLPAAPEATRTPYVDVVDRNGEIIVTADMPGVDKEDIRIDVRGDVLELSAERKAEKEGEAEGYLRHERSYRRFYRTLRLPAPVDKSRAKASFNNGVLEVILPKAERAEAGEIPVS